MSKMKMGKVVISKAVRQEIEKIIEYKDIDCTVSKFIDNIETLNLERNEELSEAFIKTFF